MTTTSDQGLSDIGIESFTTDIKEKTWEVSLKFHDGCEAISQVNKRPPSDFDMVDQIGETAYSLLTTHDSYHKDEK